MVIGTQNIKRLPMLVEQATARGASGRPIVDIDPLDDVSFPLGVARRADPAKAYVTIIEGCNEFCAFCVVPYTRGHERMRPASAILAEARQAVAEGAIEIQLLGQIVNHYQAPDDASCDFAALLERLNDIDGLERIRFASPHPRHVTPRMIARDARPAEGLPAPASAGAVGIDARARPDAPPAHPRGVPRARGEPPRRHAGHRALDRYDRRVPGRDATPTSRTRCRSRAAVRYHSMFSFKYSPRPNTLATKRLPDDVTDEEKTRRIVALQTLQREIQGELYRQAIGREELVLVESRSRRRDWELSGRTSGNTVVNFAGDPAWIGRIVRVRVTDANPNSLRAEAVAGAGAGGAVECGNQNGGVMQIEMTIKGLMVDPITNMPIIILRDKDGQRVLPIWVGVFEANAIALQMENVATPRPMTHDLLKNVISDLKADIQKIVVSDLRENTFYALIYLRRERGAGGGRRAPERRDRAGPARPGADLRRGSRDRQRQDRRLRARQGELRAAPEVAGEPGPRHDGPLQDVVASGGASAIP